MLRIFFLLTIFIFPLNAEAICNSDDTFDATSTIAIPKPKGFFTGTPKPSPQIIAEGISLAKKNVLQKFIGKCITERTKLDQYLKVKKNVESQTDNFINVIKSKQTQDKLSLHIKIRASVNGKLFESILYSLFILLWSYVTYIQNGQIICSFPRWCTEGENNTLVTENYYYKMDKCPEEYAWLTYLYEETNPPHYDNYCENTEY